MPSYRTAFPSKFVKAEDVGPGLTGTIHSVDFEDVGSGATKDRKLVVHFAEPTLKPLVLNLINCDSIAEIAGTDDYTRWPGSRVHLFATRTEFQGKRVACVRLSTPPPRPKCRRRRPQSGRRAWPLPLPSIPTRRTPRRLPTGPMMTSRPPSRQTRRCSDGRQ